MNLDPTYKERKPPDGGNGGQAMKRIVLFSGVAVAVAALIVTQGNVSMEYRITGAVGIYYLLLILLEYFWETWMERRGAK